MEGQHEQSFSLLGLASLLLSGTVGLLLAYCMRVPWLPLCADKTRHSVVQAIISLMYILEQTLHPFYKSNRQHDKEAVRIKIDKFAPKLHLSAYQPSFESLIGDVLRRRSYCISSVSYGTVRLG